MRPTGAVIGRDEELDLLDRFWRSETPAAVVSGPAGVGKSRLCSEFGSRVAAAGTRVVTIRATRCTSTVPFGAFAAQLGVDLDAGDHPVGRLEVMRRTADRVVADDHPVLIVDDAHLLDEGSAALVLHVVERNAAFVVAGIRNGEPVPDAITALWKEGLADRIELLALAEDESAALAAGLIGGPVATTTSQRIWGWSEGNPLFVGEIVRAGLAQGRLREIDGLWCWQGPMPHDERLASVVGERLAALAPAQRSVVELLAVGEPLPLDTLTGLVEAADLSALEQASLIRVSSEGRSGPDVHLAHPIYADVVLASMPVLRSREIAGRLADAVEAADPDGHEILRVARWRLDSGAHAEPTLLMAAAHRAMAVSDFALGERLAAAARDGGATEAGVLRGDALYWLGRYTEAEQLLAGLDADGLLLARAAIVRASALFWGLGRAAEADAVLDDCLAHIQPPELGLEVRAHRATLHFFDGAIDDAISEAQSVLDSPAASRVAVLRALTALGPALAVRGDRAAAVATAERAAPEAMALTSEYPSGLADLMIGLYLAHERGGALADALVIATMIRETALRDRIEEWQGAAVTVLGRARLLSGAADDAAGLLREGAVLLRNFDAGGFLPWCLGLLAHAEAMRGRPDVGALVLEEIGRLDRPALGLLELDIGIARVRVLEGRGERAEARRVAEETAAMGAAGGVWAAVAATWYELARLGQSAAAAAALEQILATVDNDLTRLYRDHAAGLATRDGNALDEVAERFATVGMWWHAAETASAAVTAHRDVGLPGRAAHSAARAAELAARCPGAALPEATGAVDVETIGALTEREREVVGMAARGLTNREIATKLFVSIRTVNNHLNHAYAKLGVATRDDLRALLALELPSR